MGPAVANVITDPAAFEPSPTPLFDPFIPFDSVPHSSLETLLFRDFGCFSSHLLAVPSQSPGLAVFF